MHKVSIVQARALDEIDRKEIVADIICPTVVLLHCEAAAYLRVR
jgi:hypothetical protein